MLDVSALLNTDVLLGLLLILAVVTGGLYLFRRKPEGNADSGESRGGQAYAHLLPLRTGAAERLLLFLERIRPEALVATYSPGEFNSAHQLMRMLQQQVQAEYDHNVVQQLYVTPETWNAVHYAKDATLKLFELTLEKMPEKSSPLDYRNQLLKTVKEQPDDQPGPIDEAVMKVKQEYQQWTGVFE